MWTISQSGTLYGLNPATGAAVQQFAIGPVANHYPTPSVGDGLLLAPAASDVVAFAGPVSSAGRSTTGGATSTTGATGTSTTAKAASTVSRGKKQGPLAVAATGVGIVALLAVLGFVLYRVRRPRDDGSGSGPRLPGSPGSGAGSGMFGSRYSPGPGGYRRPPRPGSGPPVTGRGS